MHCRSQVGTGSGTAQQAGQGVAGTGQAHFARGSLSGLWSDATTCLKFLPLHADCVKVTYGSMPQAGPMDPSSCTWLPQPPTNACLFSIDAVPLSLSGRDLITNKIRFCVIQVSAVGFKDTAVLLAQVLVHAAQCSRAELTGLVLQARKKRSVAHTQARCSSATPKRAEQMEEDVSPSSAAPPAHQIADEAQQDTMQMDSSQGGAVTGSPAGDTLDMHVGGGHEGDVHEREAPRTLASRISRFAGIFTGRRNTPDTPTGECSADDGACFTCIRLCDDSTPINGRFCVQR